MNGSPPVLPDVSVLMVTHKHGAFIREAMQSILSQTALPEELVVFDDASPDHTWDEIQAVVAGYHGPVRIRAERQPRRRGGAGNRLDAWRATSGRLVVIAHGDDRSRPTRLERIHTVWRSRGASTISSDAVHLIDGEQGERNVDDGRGDREIGLEEMCDAPFRQHLLGATLALDRVVCERFPATMPSGDLGAGPGDMIFPLRGALLGGHHYIDAPLIEWRRHDDQTSLRFLHLAAEHPQARRETIDTFYIFGLLQRLRDLQHYANGPHDKDKYRVALERTLKTWLRRVGQWHGARQTLESEGWQRSWQ